MQVKHIAGPWKSGERLMVAVSASPFSEQAVRWTRRMAYNLEAPWLAVFVETSRSLTAAQQEQLARNLDLVRSLGRRSRHYLQRQCGRGDRTHGAPAQCDTDCRRQAARHSVVAARTRRHPGGQADPQQRAIDIYIVAGESQEQAPHPHPRCQLRLAHSPWKRYVWALLIVAALTVSLAIVSGTFAVVWLPGHRTHRAVCRAADRRLSGPRACPGGSLCQCVFVELSLYRPAPHVCHFRSTGRDPCFCSTLSLRCWQAI